MVHCKSIDYLLLLENSRNFAKKQQILDESDAIQMTSVMMIINIITWSQRCRTIAVFVLKSSRDNKIHITINSPSSYYHITSLKQNRFFKRKSYANLCGKKHENFSISVSELHQTKDKGKQTIPCTAARLDASSAEQMIL